MLKFIAIIIVLVTISLLGFYFYNLGPTNKSNNKNILFVIPKGQPLSEIAKSLKQKKLIRDENIFIIYTKIKKLDNKLQSGDFLLNPSMSVTEITEELVKGGQDIWITIPEGRRADEIADLLEDNIQTYDPSWREELNKEEGYLFPDTYLLPKKSTLSTVINNLKNNFENKYSTIDNNSSVSKNDLVIIASLIEREARHDEDRSLVASVIYNRLTISMALQLDATVQYVLGFQQDQNRWWKNGLTINDLRIDSPYNTYKYPGLPPGPISNPGLKSLEAAANPAQTDYLYYITDSQGINRYARTLEEHNSNIDRYGLSR